MNVVEGSSEDIERVLRIERTKERPTGPSEVDAFMQQDVYFLENDDGDAVGYLGVKDATYVTGWMALLPDHRQQKNVEQLLDAHDVEKFNIEYADEWLIESLKEAGYIIADEYGLPYAPGGYVLYDDS